MLKCIHRLYADSLIFTIYNSTQLVKSNFFKYKILKISAAFYSSNSYLPVFCGKKVIFAIICHAGKYREIPPGNTWGGIFRPTLDKNGAIWGNLGVPKYGFTNLKISNCKVTKSTTTKLNYHIFLSDQRDVHAIKMIRFRT